jgi:hypothetical protein
MKLKKATKQDLIYFVIAIVIVGITIFSLNIAKMFKKPTEYTIARNDRITNYENAVAYVIRNEEVIPTDSFEGERKIVAGDSTKVAKNGVIATYIEKNVEDNKAEIEEIDEKIQSIIDSEDFEYPQELKTIDKQIGQEIYNLGKKKNEYTALTVIKDDIDEMLYGKITAIGNLNLKNSELKSLISERISYETNKYSYKKDLNAPKSGMVSYRVDGYEDYINVNNLDSINLEMLNDISYVVNQKIPIDPEKVKLIDNFSAYLAIVTNSEESMALNIGDSIKVSFDGSLSNYSKGIVERIIDEEESRIIIVSVDNNTENLSKYRKINVDIIWWNYEGLKIQNDSIYDKDFVDETTGEVYATVKAIKLLGTTGYQREVYIKLEKSTSDFSIISNYEDKELLEMGIPEAVVNSRNKINLYDRVIIN